MQHQFQGRYSQRVKRALSARGRRMAKARWAKWRANAAERPEPEPRMVRWYPLEFGVRDKGSGDVCWMDLRSGRDVQRRVAMLLKHYQPNAEKLKC